MVVAVGLVMMLKKTEEEKARATLQWTAGSELKVVRLDVSW
jgi:hypothetical protein